MDDDREAWVATSVAAQLGASVTPDTVRAQLTEGPSAAALAAFLDSETCLVLQAEAKGVRAPPLAITLATTCAPSSSADVRIVFAKTPGSPLTLANMATRVMTTTLGPSPAASLFYALHNIYLPLLARPDNARDHLSTAGRAPPHGSPAGGGADWSSTALPHQLLELLDQVDAGLGAAVRRGGFGAGSSAQDSGVLTASDEVLYWADESDAAVSGAAADAVRSVMPRFGAALSALAAPDVSLLAALDEAESLYDALHELWEAKAEGQWAYPEARMRTFLRLLGAAITAVVQRALGDGAQLWAGDSHSPLPDLEASHQLVRLWGQQLRSLSSDWTGGVSAHAWAGEPPVDTRIQDFLVRLEDVCDLAALRSELMSSAGKRADQAAAVRTAFAQLASVDVLQVGPCMAPRWQAAKQQLAAALGPLKREAAERLKALLSGHLIPSLSAAVAALGHRAAGAHASTAQPYLLFQDLLQHRCLFAQPSVASCLVTEQSTIADLARDYLRHLASELERAESVMTHGDSASTHARSRGAGASHSLGSHVRLIVWLKQTALKADTAQQALRALAAGAEGVAEGPPPALAQALSDADKLLNTLASEERAKFEDWVAQVTNKMITVKGWKTAQLLEVDADDRAGRIKAHFNNDLVVLVNEVRQLKCLDFKVPAALDREMKVAEKFYHHGVKLQQVANFYNTIATQMLPCHKPCLLEYAKDFEALILAPVDRQGKAITWDHAVGLENYMAKLDDVRRALVDKNRGLRAKQAYIAERMALLARVDLVKQRQRWFALVESIRQVFQKCEGEYPRETQTAWRLYWDHQLAKLLNIQFKRDLQTLTASLPTTPVKLVYQNRTLMLEPCLEDIRATHYKDHLSPFLSLPAQVRGFSASTEAAGSTLFAAVHVDSAAEIARCYAHTEGGLFTQLRRKVEQYSDWAALGRVDDIDHFTDRQMVGTSDYAVAFEDLKAARRDLDRCVPNEEAVGCYQINLGPMKMAVEDQIARARDALVSSLRRRAQAERETVAHFVQRGHELLAAEASTVSELGQSRLQAMEIMREAGTMRDLKAAVDDKNRLLRSMARGLGGKGGAEQFVSMDEIAGEWDALMDSLGKHESSLEQQKASLAKQVESSVSKLHEKITGFQGKWEDLKPSRAPSGSADALMLQLEELRTQLSDLKAEAEQVTKDAGLFDLTIPDFLGLAELLADVDTTVGAWGQYREFSAERDELGGAPWDDVRNHLHRVDDFITKWTKACDGISNDSALKLTLLKELDGYRRCCPHLNLLRGLSWESKHWAQLFQLLGLPPSSSKGSVTLGDLLQKSDQIVASADQLKQLNAQAQAEALIRKALDELDLWGLQRKFELTETIDAQGAKLPLVKGWREMLTEVGEKQSLAGSLRQSPYFAIFKDQIEGWEKRLGVLAEALATMSQVQRKWVYLEPLFSRGALPEQAQRFRVVDETFRTQMRRLAADPLLRSLADIPEIDTTLASTLAQLDVCQKALFQYLEIKRSLFPRFYFLGDDDLLEILGQASNPAVIQSHLKKLFAGIHSVTIASTESKESRGGEAGGLVTHMNSIDGDSVPLSVPVTVTQTVEGWLAELTVAMRQTLQASLQGSHGGVDPKRFAALPSQTIGLEQSVRFTAFAEECIGGGRLAELRASVDAALTECTSHDFSKHKLAQLKVKSLVLDVIHQRDICILLSDNKVTSTSNWLWQKQLRYYSEDPREGGTEGELARVKIQMVEAAFRYSWEYQGNAPKLVYTPLTDKCYLTLTQGMSLGYGGNPYGPAGTGKTESVKALGQAFARQVLVFNCDEEFDFKSMGRIFVGLVKCGAWGCFDEFNRLEEDVLSAVSQQIQTIQTALKAGSSEIVFMDAKCRVDMNAGIFVTMNPAGKGYGGRSKLPDNLKQLFRSVAMAVPDNELIAEVMLLSEGFGDAQQLGRKLVSLFSLSKQLLSGQQHYDWGLRALKTILGIAGKMLHEITLAKGASSAPSSEVEARLVLRAVRATKLPTLTYDDLTSFKQLMRDMWPSVSVEDVQDSSLVEALETALHARQLLVVPEQMEKAQQLHLACEQRIGVILVGPSGSGKSTLWEVLADAYKLQEKPPIIYKINPKALPRQLLLGRMDLDTREWHDGVLTACARKVVKAPLEQRSWIICDGDVDPEWIESLNSVLDDNRLLTMPNGERIQFGSNVNFIFECHSLEFASPATVSRCGMIYMSDENVDAQRSLVKYMRTNSLDSHPHFGDWVDQFFQRALQWVLGQPAAVGTSKVGAMNNALSQLREVEDKRGFVVGVARGFGANLTHSVRAALLQALEEWSGERDLWAASGPPPLLHPDNAGPAGGADIVMTQHLAALLAVVAPWVRSREPFMLSGPVGCGRATLLRAALQGAPGAVVAEMACNAQTNAEHVIQKLLQVCGKPVTKADKKVLRARSGGALVFILRDLDLARPDKYNTVQVTSLLQQCIVHGGFYDAALEFVHLENVQFVATIGPPGAVGREALSTRFTGVIRILSMSEPAQATLQEIFSTRAAAVLAGTGEHNSTWHTPDSARRLAEALLETCARLKAALPPDEHAHYAVTACDVASWLDALTHYDWTDASLRVEAAAVNEARRLFRDRLVDESARSACDGIFASTLLPKLGVRDPTAALREASLFSTLGAAAEARVRGAESAHTLVKWSCSDFSELVADKLKRYEREIKPLHMQLFPQALDLVARFDRALARPGGALLAIGPSGVGRRTALSLVAFAQHLELMSPACMVGSGAKQFRVFLKDVLRKAGVEGTAVCVFLEDHHLVEPALLEYVNSLLSSGEVPGLFTTEELDKELKSLDAVKADEGAPDVSNYHFFVQRIQKNLRIALSLAPDHPSFRSRLASNPALLTRCAVQWIDAWSGDSAAAIARHLCGVTQPGGVTQPDAKGVTMDDEDHPDLSAPLQAIHAVALVRKLATPRHFVTLVEQYLSIYASKRSDLRSQLAFLEGGLGKLAQAEGTVDALSRGAVTQREELKVAQGEVDEAMTKIEAAMTTAASRRSEVQRLGEQQGTEQGKVTERKAFVEEELQEVQPLIEKARRAVGNLKADNLAEVRSLKAPPAAIRDVLEAVLRLMGQTDTSWNNMKKFLAGTGVKDRIVNFDARDITPEMRNAVRRLIAEKPESFEPERIFRVSVAAAPMAEWVQANLRYSEVVQHIMPLQKELDALEASLARGAERLGECEAELGELDAQKAALQEDFRARNEEATMLKLNLQKAEATLTAASSLLGKLSSEKRNWSSQAGGLRASLQHVARNAALAAAFITYAASEAEAVRASLVHEWCSAVELSTFNFRSFMSSESELLKCKAEGLPGDQVSAENAVIVQASVLTPLLVDPSTSACGWLRGHLQASGVTLEATSFQDPRFTTTLELAVRFGKVLFIQEADAIDPVIYNVLRRDLHLQGMGHAVYIGDRRVDYNDAFRVYITTRNPAPDLPPAARALLTVANFTITRSGLESQILAATIQHEQPELEQQRSALLNREEAMKVELSDLNHRLLTTLAHAEGDILENAALVQSLDETKAKASDIDAALASARSVQEDLDAQRNAYTGVSTLAASLFFVLADLQALNPMYHFSLAAFLRLFASALHSATPSTDVALRISAIKPEVVRCVSSYTLRSLFNCDRLTFTMHLVHSAFQHHPSDPTKTLFPPHEWSLFSGSADAGAAPRSVPKWLPQHLEARFQGLVGAAPELVQAANLEDSSTWAPWVTESEAERLPAAAKGLSLFQGTLIVQALRPDRLLPSLQQLTRSLLGPQGSVPADARIASLFQESQPRVPILFITSPAADPSQELLAYATEQVGSQRYHEVAMGQGQTEGALDLLRACAADGSWLCLKNIHLVASWLPHLERAVYALAPHATFRLWLTSEATDRMPATLLENALKVTVEAPPGLKRNLQRTLGSWPPEFIQGKTPQRTQLLLLLAWFHAVVQERRTYIPQGWSKFYEFSSADLATGAELVGRMLRDGGRPQWPLLLGLLESAIYGGRVDDASDMRVMRTYLTKFFSARVLEGQERLLGTAAVVPATGHVGEIKQLVESLPDANAAALFGLAANVGRSVAEAACTALMAGLRRLGLRQIGGTGFVRAEWRKRLGPLLSSWEGLVGSSQVLQAARRVSRTHSLGGNQARATGDQDNDPMAAFLARETHLATTLVALLDTSLSSLSALLSGTAPLTTPVAALAASLLQDAVPAEWEAAWEGPEGAGAYMRGVASRAAGLKVMVAASRAGTLLGGAPLALHHFFNPSTFLNTVRQATARQTGAAMDALAFANSWDASDLSSRSPVVVLVTGLVMEGAKFGGGDLVDHVSANDPTSAGIKPCAFAWVNDGDSDVVARRAGKASGAASLAVPVYTRRGREKLLFELSVPVASAAAREAFILSGTACFLAE